MQTLLETMRRLRGPGGCPWDREQTHESLRPYLLEEAAEAVEAIHTGDPLEMADELGDVLLQVAFHAVIAEEAGTFSYETIEEAIVNKLVRRHPHVFADTRVENAAEVVRNWQSIKADEKGEERPAAERVPRSLPALMRAAELGKGLAWPQGSPEGVEGAFETARASGIETGSEGAARLVGVLLLAVVDWARGLGVNPELALREAADARAEQP